MRLIAKAATILAVLSSTANAAPFMCTLAMEYSCDLREGCKAEEGVPEHYWIVDATAKTMTYCNNEGTQCAEHGIETLEIGDLYSPTLSKVGAYSFDERGKTLTVAHAGTGLGAAFSRSQFYRCVAMPSAGTKLKKVMGTE